MNWILDNLAIGDFHEALRPPSAITALLCVAEEHPLPPTSLLAHKVPMVDMKSIPLPLLKEAVDWLAAHIGDHRILVYCHGGVGRSPSVVVAYLCCALEYGFGEAVELVATRKPRMVTLPNLILRIADMRLRVSSAADA